MYIIYNIMYIYIHVFYIYIYVYTYQLQTRVTIYLDFVYPGLYTGNYTQRIINPLCQCMSWSIIYYVMGVCAVNTICLGQRCTSQKQIKLIESSGFFQAMQVSTATISHNMNTRISTPSFIKKILSRIQFELKCFLRENGSCLTPPDTLF